MRNHADIFEILDDGMLFLLFVRIMFLFLLFFFQESRRPLVKALVKNDASSFLFHTLRSLADDRGLGHEISLQIHQILAIIGHHG